MARMLARLLVLLGIGIGVGLPAAAQAQQEWLLNPTSSHFYMQTAKANSMIEIQQFSGLDGSVSKDGDASVKIDLTSIASGIDVRDVRMRFLLFETFKFPNAEVTAKLDMAKLQELNSSVRIAYPLKLTVNLHGITKQLDAQVNVTRVSDKAVSVATAKPIVVNADMFALGPGIVKLSEAVNGTPIVAAASFTFDLVFETGDKIPEIQQVRAIQVERKQREETAPISAEACETRFSVISTTGAIYFRTGSDELDRASEPLLNSVADIANRCPGVRIEVTGHTDSVGGRESNQRLSEHRARSVVSYLGDHGVKPQRIEAAGFGDTRPVVPNDSEANRAKNRRIEFRVIGR